jgi:hypothetical protein
VIGDRAGYRVAKFVAAIAIVASEIFPFTVNKSGVKNRPEEGTSLLNMS